MLLLLKQPPFLLPFSWLLFPTLCASFLKLPLLPIVVAFDVAAPAMDRKLV